MKKGVTAAIVVLVLAIIGAAIYWFGFAQPDRLPQPKKPQHARPKAPRPPSQPSQPSPKPTQPSRGGRGEAEHQPSAPPAERYCADGHDEADTQRLTRAGGLIPLFQHESTLADAYGCASAYLAHGGDVNAANPRADSRHLTPLLFAIKRNDPKMVRFLLDHGADPNQRGGPKKIRPYGYAVFQALHNRSTNYNRVIDLLNSALGDNPASSGG